MSESEYKDVISDGKNKNVIKCKFCSSKILSSNTVSYISQEFKLPLIKQKTDCLTTETEELKDYWEVDDMYTFENIGFTHTVDQIKYLSCADCEMGPIGYFDITLKKSYVALARVIQ